MKRILDLLWANRTTIIVTIEIFWVVVFLLDAATRGMGDQATGFVYANF
jgi:hypothetical protein